ncbi:hypothetical protein L6164_019771 [Bauhinia variegata]|uniref:Uncharacterized protein n=1 Tax=Bauhinia variegata TaxID=167791 RepID=A0ACB9MT55_BAUVA|nr:hypothetical protein L6164_019771 [Bauhinia variegata]
MEETKKSQKLPSTCNQESERNGQLNKQDQARAGVELGTITKTSSPSPSHDNMPCSNQQTPPIVQYVSKYYRTAQQVQAFLLSPSPFWHLRLPACPALGANVPTIFQTFTPPGTNNAGWEAHPVMARGTSSTHDSQFLLPCWIRFSWLSGSLGYRRFTVSLTVSFNLATLQQLLEWMVACLLLSILFKEESSEHLQNFLKNTSNFGKLRKIISFCHHEKISGAATGISGNAGINRSTSMLSTHQGIQISQTVFNSASGVEVNGGRDMDLKIAHSELSQPAKVLNNYMDISDNYIGSRGNRSLVWPSDISRQSFFHNGSFIKQDGKITPGWSFANEEDASEELEDAVVGSDKEENEQEMGDDGGSGAEEIDGTKD